MARPSAHLHNIFVHENELFMAARDATNTLNLRLSSKTKDFHNATTQIWREEESEEGQLPNQDLSRALISSSKMKTYLPFE